MRGTAGEPDTVHPSRKNAVISVFSIAAILIHLVFRTVGHTSVMVRQLPLIATLLFGGLPLVWELLGKLARRQFGSDLLAGISIVTSVLLGEYLAGSLVVLMLSGGEALENYAVRSASAVLQALAKRLPAIAHLKRESNVVDVPFDEVAVGGAVLIHSHE